MLGNESKVLAHLQPQIRLWHPAIVGMDGVVLGQLSGNEPARWRRQKMERFELEQQAVMRDWASV